jgi:hypothetical protein
LAQRCACACAARAFLSLFAVLGGGAQAQRRVARVRGAARGVRGAKRRGVRGAKRRGVRGRGAQLRARARRRGGALQRKGVHAAARARRRRSCLLGALSCRHAAQGTRPGACCVAACLQPSTRSLSRTAHAAQLSVPNQQSRAVRERGRGAIWRQHLPRVV